MEKIDYRAELADLRKSKCGCYTHKIDDRLAICMGYDDAGLIWMGLKCWTSDYMLTDYHWINIPWDAETDDTFDCDTTVDENSDFEGIEEYILDTAKMIRAAYDVDEKGKCVKRRVSKLNAKQYLAKIGINVEDDLYHIINSGDTMSQVMDAAYILDNTFVKECDFKLAKPVIKCYFKAKVRDLDLSFSKSATFWAYTKADVDEKNLCLKDDPDHEVVLVDLYNGGSVYMDVPYEE